MVEVRAKVRVRVRVRVRVPPHAQQLVADVADPGVAQDDRHARLVGGARGGGELVAVAARTSALEQQVEPLLDR